MTTLRSGTASDGAGKSTNYWWHCTGNSGPLSVLIHKKIEVAGGERLYAFYEVDGKTCSCDFCLLRVLGETVVGLLCIY